MSCPERIKNLSCGKIESRTLKEITSLDFNTLLGSLGLLDKPSIEDLPNLCKFGILERMKISSSILINHVDKKTLSSLSHHTSDTVRGMAAFALAKLNSEKDVQRTLSTIEPFAKDTHFGVREWAWMATREDLAASLDEAITALVAWCKSPHKYIRRYAVEVLRPRGVWARHILTLRKEPHRGLVLLDPLKREEEKYVQDSVANWLNDAAKDNPTFVEEVCSRWALDTNHHPATIRICLRAQRSLKPLGNRR